MKPKCYGYDCHHNDGYGHGMGDITEDTPISREPSHAPDKPDTDSVVDQRSVMLFWVSVLFC